MRDYLKFYINGEWVRPAVKEYFDVINPATGEVIAKTPLGTKADVDAAAKAGLKSSTDRRLLTVAAAPYLEPDRNRSNCEFKSTSTTDAIIMNGLRY